VKEIRTAKKNLPVGRPTPPDLEAITIEEETNARRS